MPRAHYYEPKDIHLKSQRKNMITCWLCGYTEHTTNKFPQGRESRENRGKKTQEYACRRPRIHFKEEVHLMKQNCCSSLESSDSRLSKFEHSEEHVNVQQCNFMDSDECNCNPF